MQATDTQTSVEQEPRHVPTGRSGPAAPPDALPNAGMRLSPKGLALIKDVEGYHRRRKDGSAEAYRCPAGVWTIGWGCTEGVREGMVVSAAKAEAMLERELSHFEIVVGKLVTVPLSQCEFDALVSFTYNVGEGALAKSTLLKLLNRGDRSAVPNQLLRWTRGGGRELPGLVRRRKAEASLFLATDGGKKRSADPDDDLMPQRVEPQRGSPMAVVQRSRTFWGAVLAFVGWGGSAVVDGLGIVGQAATEAQTSTGALMSFFGAIGVNAHGVGIAIGIAGLVAVLFARFDAAAEEKEG